MVIYMNLNKMCHAYRFIDIHGKYMLSNSMFITKDKISV